VRSTLGDFLTVFHLQLLIVGIYLLTRYHRYLKEGDSRLVVLSLWVLAGLGLLLFALFGYFMTALLIILFILCFISVFQSMHRTDELYISCILTLCMGILVGCEFIHIVDAYGRQLQRMNTLFKLHYQVWILLGIAAPWIMVFLGRSRSIAMGVKSLLCIAVGGLLVLNLFYPIGVSWGRLPIPKPGYPSYPKPPRTLDGMAYLEKENNGDYQAIQFLNKEIQGTPVILEYPGKRAYSYESRVSSNTGLPTLIGWINHEAIWRKGWVQKDNDAQALLKNLNKPLNGWSIAQLRQSDGERIYQANRLAPVVNLLKKYQIEYIYIGELERNNFAGPGLDKFATELEKIYDRAGVLIYRVPENFLK